MSAHGAARALAQALSGLQVHPQRMRANLDAVVASVPKAVAAEWFSVDLLRHAAQVTGLQSEMLRDSLS